MSDPDRYKSRGRKERTPEQLKVLEMAREKARLVIAERTKIKREMEETEPEPAPEPEETEPPTPPPEPEPPAELPAEDSAPEPPAEPSVPAELPAEVSALCRILGGIGIPPKCPPCPTALDFRPT